jgi:hypothetical protein
LDFTHFKLNFRRKKAQNLGNLFSKINSVLKSDLADLGQTTFSSSSRLSIITKYLYKLVIAIMLHEKEAAGKKHGGKCRLFLPHFLNAIFQLTGIGIFEFLWGEMWGREGDSDGGSTQTSHFPTE